MTNGKPHYSVQVMRVGTMPEVPACCVRSLQDFDQWESFCYTMLIARSPEATVVVNAGFPDDISSVKRFFRQAHPRFSLQVNEDERADQRLQQAGVDPASVPYLVLSWLGPYSTGRVDLFTNATICIGRTEWIDFHAPPAHIPPSNPYHIVFPPHILQQLVLGERHRVRLLDDEDEVCPGIRVFRTGTHHRGSLSVAIETAAGTVVYTDAVFTYSNLEQNTPIGYCRNVDEFYMALVRIRKEAAIILPAFDPQLFVRYPDGIVVPGR